MELFIWNDKYSVNIKQIDEQHKTLINLINDLATAMKAGKGKDTLGIVIGRLIDYTKTHFATEEVLMKEYKYPEESGHKKTHEDFVFKVVDVHTKFQSGNLFLSTEVLQFLQDWLINHIGAVDKKFGAFLNSKGLK